MDRRPLVPPGAGLSAPRRTRYARHLLLPGFGVAGQESLSRARILLIGAGGLGSPAALYLAAAGVGTIGLIDDDEVDLTNLQRQILHGTADVGRAKVDSARDALARLDDTITVITHRERLTADNALTVLADYDLVLDGADNFPTRALVSETAARLLMPHVWASVFRFEAQLSVWSAGEGPCYHCVFPEQPGPDQVPSCAVGGVLGASVGAVGSILAVEAIKVITGIGEPLIGRLLVHDGLAQTWAQVPVRARADCAVCGPAADHRRPLGSAGGGGVVGAAPAADPDRPTVSVTELAEILARGGVLVDVREPGEREIVAVPGSIPVPLAEVLAGSAPWPPGRVHVMCKSGGRSARAVDALRRRGIDAVDVRGGILAWVAEVDPSQPTY